MYICIYMYIYVCMNIHICIHVRNMQRGCTTGYAHVCNMHVACMYYICMHVPVCIVYTICMQRERGREIERSGTGASTLRVNYTRKRSQIFGHIQTVAYLHRYFDRCLARYSERYLEIFRYFFRHILRYIIFKLI